MPRRNEDLAFFLGGAFIGTTLTKIAVVADHPASVCSLGVLLIAGIFIQRIRADRPSSVRGDLGIRILDPEFHEAQVSFSATLRGSVDYGLRIVCDVPIVGAVASAHRQMDAGGSRSGPEVDLFVLQTKKIAHVLLQDPGDSPETGSYKEVRVTITTSSPAKRVWVGFATTGQVRSLLQEAKKTESRAP